MNKTELLNLIKKTEFWTEEAPGLLQTCIPFMHGFIEQGRCFGMPYHTFVFIYGKDGYFHEKTPIKEKFEIFMHIFNNLKKDSKYIDKKIGEWRKIREEFFSLFNQINNIDNKSNNELKQLYNKFIELFTLEFSYPIAVEGADGFFELELDNFLKRNKIELDDKSNDLLILTKPAELSFMEEEKLELLNIALEFKKNKIQNYQQLQKSKTLFNKLKKHSQNYFWIENNYKDTKYLDEKYYFSKISEIEQKDEKEILEEIARLNKSASDLKEKKQNLKQFLKLNDESKLLFFLLEKLVWWQDQRKKAMLQGVYYQNLLLKEIAKRFNYTLYEIQHMKINEINGLFENKKLSKQIIKERMNGFVYITTKRGEFLLVGEDYKAIKDAFDKKLVSEEIKGFTASAPVNKFKGKVNIVLDTKKDKFKSGCILVTSMTRPEFVPLMKKASAFITDEGGLTCHAAIISREMKKPCIIGTKNATKLLKNNMHVEMNLKTGIIRIIK